jgi:adenylylsulfate kinase
MKLVILASGRGSRLNHLTSKKPKCLVMLNNRTIISYLRNSFKLFNETIIITGYRSNLIKNEIKGSATFVRNKDYMKTNMIHSLFCSSHLINEDIIVSYSDIIFDPLVLKKLFKCKRSTLPLNSLWLDTWKKRMSMKDIYIDAEDVKLKGKEIISIGGKIIKGKLPKTQFMGLMKIKKNDFFKMKKKYQSNTLLIDGDEFRNIFNNDLGYTVDDRKKNAIRISNFCKFCESQSISVVCAILSIFPEIRDLNKKNLLNYYEVFIDSPMEDLKQRDGKKLYENFYKNKIKNVVGLDINFNKPYDADLVIENNRSLEDLLSYVQLISKKIIKA